MPKVKIKAGCGKHRDKDGKVYSAGDVVEVSDLQAKAFADKFEPVRAAAAKDDGKEKG